MDRIPYLDFVALPIFFVLIYATYIRKMTDGISNKLFLFLLYISVITTISDIMSCVLCKGSVISDTAVTIVFVSATVYHIFHTLTGIVYLMFIMSETRSWYWMT